MEHMRTLYPGHQVVVLSLLAQHDATECFTWERLWQYYHAMMLQQRQRSHVIKHGNAAAARPCGTSQVWPCMPISPSIVLQHSSCAILHANAA